MYMVYKLSTISDPLSTDEIKEDNNSVATVYSNNGSQASQESHTPTSSTKTMNESITKNSNVSQTSQFEKMKSLISCHYCDYTNYDENKVLKHSVNRHPSKPARPDPSLIELMKKIEEEEKNM